MSAQAENNGTFITHAVRASLLNHSLLYVRVSDVQTPRIDDNDVPFQAAITT